MRRLYAVRFGDAGFMGPRGEVVLAVRRAGLHWTSKPAQGMADVLGGEVVVWDGVSDDVTVAVPEEPF
jgi:hypothetical protein